jgi:hypothetical protein
MNYLNEEDKYSIVNEYIKNDEIPPVLQDSFRDIAELLQFNTEVYEKVKTHLLPALHELMIRQYPVFTAEERPLLLKHLDCILHSVSYSLMVKLYRLLQDQNKNIHAREKYPEFEKWLEFYARPQNAAILEKEDRPTDAGINAEEWEIYRLRVNKEIIEIFNHSQNRLKDFVRTVHNIIFEQLPELMELNADEWIVFSVIMRDEYENFSTLCSHAEVFINNGFPEENMNACQRDFYKKYLKLYNTFFNQY